MWDELREELDLNLQQLRQQLTIARCLHQEMGERNPGATQIMAWAAILHSFYTGKEKLKKYMDFRHVFRHAYTYDLQWNKMAPLVLDLGDVFNQLEQEVNEFISKFLI